MSDDDFDMGCHRPRCDSDDEFDLGHRRPQLARKRKRSSKAIMSAAIGLATAFLIVDGSIQPNTNSVLDAWAKAHDQAPRFDEATIGIVSFFCFLVVSATI